MSIRVPGLAAFGFVLFTLAACGGEDPVYYGTAELTVGFGGDGMGQITGPGIDCGYHGDDCTESIAYGSTIRLVATPDPGSVAAWELCETVDGDACMVRRFPGVKASFFRSTP